MSGLLDTGRDLVTERGKVYGPAKETAERFAWLCEVLEVDVREPRDYPRAMICAKLARDIHIRHHDTAPDIAGYLEIAGEME